MENLIGEESASAPRRRLIELLCPAFFRHGRGNFDEEEAEIARLAKQHPEVFVKELTIKPRQEKNYSQSPLSMVLSFECKESAVSPETFEAVYKAFPDAIHAVDSFGNTVLLELLRAYRWCNPIGNRTSHEERWFVLLQSLLGKSNALLTVMNKEQTHTPITMAMFRGCPEHVLQFMIDNHPGDPFREVTRYGSTLLSAVVEASHHYTFEFVKYIYNKNPDAVRVQESCSDNYTVLHHACHNRFYRSPNPALLSLLLTGHPPQAFLTAAFRELPLRTLIGLQPWVARNHEDRQSLALVALANPKAIFTTMRHITDDFPSSPFSMLSNLVLGEGRGERTDELIQDAWRCLYFLMNVYRGNRTNLMEAWQPPQFPVHLAASCPCPSNFLLHLARSNPEHLLQVDLEGRTVLALALESGHSVVKQRENDDESSFRCIQKLVQIDIRAVGLQDPKTKLYPFMIAATMARQIVEMGILDNHLIDLDKGKSSPWMGKYFQDNEDRAPLICLNTIYFLLRADPSKTCPASE